MNLTSLARLKAYLGINHEKEDGVLLRLISTASSQIQKWLRRQDGIELKSRTQYFSPSAGQASITVDFYPIASITSIYLDSTGLWTGNQTLVPSTDYLISEDGRTIVFINGLLYQNTPRPLSNFQVYPKSVRIIYTAGLATSPCNSAWTTSADSGGTMAEDNYIQGETSRALGKIIDRQAGTIEYECLYGVFEAGESIAEYDSIISEGGGECQPDGPTGVTATLTAATSVSLAESNTDLVTACEMHVRYYRSNRDNFENVNVIQDGVTRSSRSELGKDYFSLPEIRDILDTYKNKVIQ